MDNNEKLEWFRTWMKTCAPYSKCDANVIRGIFATLDEFQARANQPAAPAVTPDDGWEEE